MSQNIHQQINAMLAFYDLKSAGFLNDPTTGYSERILELILIDIPYSEWNPCIKQILKITNPDYWNLIFQD